MTVQEAKSRLKSYLIFTLVFWIGLPSLGFLIFQLIDIPDSPALETGLSGFFGVIGFLWLADTFRSFKAIFILIKSWISFKKIPVNKKNIRIKPDNKEIKREAEQPKDYKQSYSNLKYLVVFLLIVILLMFVVPLLTKTNESTGMSNRVAGYECNLENEVLLKIGQKTYGITLNQIEDFYLLGQSKGYEIQMIKQFEDDFYAQTSFDYCKLFKEINIQAGDSLYTIDLGDAERFIVNLQDLDISFKVLDKQ